VFPSLPSSSRNSSVPGLLSSRADDKLARANKLGADGTINYRKSPVWWEQVRDLCGGRGVDHVVDVGGPGTLDQSIKALKGGGFIAVVGLLSDTETIRSRSLFAMRELNRLPLVVVNPSKR
jgi:NADPH:quinone reductase-like Zn-dependent oxidoreductase